MEYTKLLEKIKDFKFNPSGHIEDYIMWNHEQKKEGEKKVNIQDSMDKTNFFISTMYLALVQF